jgi:hypothetical protein
VKPVIGAEHNIPRITVQRDQPRVRTNYPAYAALLGLAVIAAGVFMNVLAWRSAHGGVPRPIAALALLGFSCMMCGALLSGYTIKGMRQRRRVTSDVGRQSWRFDNPWNPEGAEDGGSRRVRNNAFAIGGIILFLIPFHLILREGSSAGLRWFFFFILGIFDLAMIVIIGHTFFLFVRRLTFGRTRVLFRQFPYYTGQTLRLTFAGSQRLASCEGLKATLHCIKEYYEWSGSGNSRMATPIMESVWRGKCAFSTDISGSAELTFDLPHDVPGTDLIGDAGQQIPYYWELEVTAKIPGIDYEGIFLIPVYEKE